MAWSSANNNLGLPMFLLMFTFLLLPRDSCVDLDPCTLVRCRFNDELPLDHLNSFLDANQPQPSCLSSRGVAEASSLVDDGELDAVLVSCGVAIANALRGGRVTLAE